MKKQSLTATDLWNQMGLLRQPLRSRGGHGLSGLTLAAMLLTSQSALAADLTAWNYDPTTQQLEVTAKAGIQPKYFVMAQPARIVLDLPDTEMGDVKPRASFTGGAIRQVRVSQFQPGVTRVVLELAPDVQLAPGQVKLEGKGDRWVLRPLIANQATTAIGAKPVTGEPTPPVATEAATVPLAIGADVSPVTTEPPVPSPVAVPPLSPPPAAIAVPPLGNSSAPVAVPPLATAPMQSPAPVTPPLPALAQLPPAASTPLPPDIELPSSRFIQEGNNSITISVPPPVALPTGTPEAMLPTPTQSAAQPLGVPTTATNLDIPTSARSLSVAPPAQISVPTLQAAPVNVPQTLASPSVTPLPPMAVPPLAPVTVPTTPYPVPYPTMNPGGRITTTKGGQPTGTIQTQQVLPDSNPALPGSVSVPTTSTPTTVKRQPPTSWVMQSSGLPQPVPVGPPANVPATVPPTTNLPPATVTPPAASPPPIGQPVVPPSSWVMQSSGLSQPSLVKPLPQPPVSSVIQPPIAAMPMPTSGVLTTAAAPMNPAAASSVVGVPPLAPAPLPMTGMPSVSVPPLANPTMQPTTLPAPNNSASVVEFGQPLPTQGATSLNTMPVGLPGSTIAANSGVGNAQIVPPTQTGVAQSINPAIALPAGTVLALAYPGGTELKVDPANPRQEMLVLQTEVRDASGNVVFPRGSYVMGRFEAGQGGTKFMTSAIQRGDRIVPFLAQSDPLSGGREISPTSMAIYSGAGLLAGGLVSGFSGWGLLLGGAAGAATNYLTAPKPTGAVQPGQVIPIRMLQDIPF